jgi:hypothetical protein
VKREVGDSIATVFRSYRRQSEMQKRTARMRKISVCLDEETYVSLKIMSSALMNSAPISELIRAAIYEWRIKHPLEFFRPSPAETRRHFRRLQQQISAEEIELLMRQTWRV